MKMTTLEKEVFRFVLIIVSIMVTMIVIVLIVWWVLPLLLFRPWHPT